MRELQNATAVFLYTNGMQPLWEENIMKFAYSAPVNLVFSKELR
jgi:hypothetical protein